MVDWRPTNKKRGGFFGVGILFLLLATFFPLRDPAECVSDSSIETPDELNACVDNAMVVLNVIKWLNGLGLIFCFIGIYRAIGYVDP